MIEVVCETTNKKYIYPFQVGDSGIAQHFESLLDTRLNDKGYKSVVGIYNNIVKQVNANGTQVQLYLEFK